MNFTHANHLKYYISNRLFGHRINSLEPYRLTVGAIDLDRYVNGNYRTELLRTAELIKKDLGSEFVLFLSGGTDSEIVARNFVEIGMSPTCYTIKFKDDYNLSDVIEAVDLANSLNLPLEIIEFDVKDFLYSGKAEDFGSKIQCTQITYLMVYNCILHINRPAIMGGEVLLKRNIYTEPSTWYYCIRENEDASAMRFSNMFNLPLVNEYFSYTPELLLHYLEHPSIQQLVTHESNFKLTSVSSKNVILKALLPEIRTRIKTHGFEKLLGFNFEAYRKLSSQQIMRLEPSVDGIEYKKVLQELRGNHESN